jgi:hypothetical protein
VVGPNYQIAVSASATMVPPGSLVPGSNCDNCVVNIALPFSYTLYDTPYTSVYASSNGTLQFGNPNVPGDNTCLAAPLAGDTILAYWDKITASNNEGRGIYTATSGVAPNRVFTVGWAVGRSTNRLRYHFQVNLYEGESRFEIVYAEIPDKGRSSTVGVQANGDPIRFTQYECNRNNSVQPGMKLVFDRKVCPGLKPGNP